MSIDIDVNKMGLDGIKKMLEDTPREMKEALLRAIYDDGVEIFKASQEIVPVDTGDLRASARLEPPTMSDPTVVLSYDEEHAAIVHENVKQHTFNHGKQSHYLSKPYHAVIDDPGYESNLEERINENIARGRGIRGLRGRRGRPGPLAKKRGTS
jgi:hypothetical protein